jgi:hypothetical protein
MAEAFEQRERLDTEEWSRFNDQIMAVSERLKQAGKQYQDLAALPISLPDPNPKKPGVNEGRELWLPQK